MGWSQARESAMRNRNRAFTLLELLMVIAIILVLGGLLIAGAGIAQRTAKRKRSEAVVHILATASEAYWGIYRDYPYPEPDYVGVGTDTLGANAVFRVSPNYDGGWTDEGRNVTLVWLLSVPRNPEPLLNTNEKWYKKIDATTIGPDGRTLFKCLDGFDHVIRIERPQQYYYQNTYMKITSAGPDGEFGIDPADVTKKADNFEVYLRR